jgi:D-ribose pyranase
MTPADVATQSPRLRDGGDGGHSCARSRSPVRQASSGHAGIIVCGLNGGNRRVKKSGILNHQLAGVIAAMGHTDLLVVADAGFPVPPGVLCVDLAVTAGLPPFLDVTRAIAAELEVEALTIADESLARDPALAEALQRIFPAAHVHHLPHEDFKRLSARARAVVRTGECTPYHNVILTAGVTF